MIKDLIRNVRFWSLFAYHYFFLNVRFQYKADIQIIRKQFILIPYQ